MGGKIIGPQVSGAGGSQDTLNGIGKMAYQQKEYQKTDIHTTPNVIITKGGKKTRRKRSKKKKSSWPIIATHYWVSWPFTNASLKPK